MSTVTINRKTAETDISLSLSRGTGVAKIDTGCGFLDHMLTLLARHSGLDLTVTCKGDIAVDAHHTTEDVGICLGLAVAELAGDKKGLSRYGYMILPMDETLILSAIDLSGRATLCFEASIPASTVGTFDTELVEEFWLAFVREARVTLHIKQLSGSNSHHIIEGIFKSVAHSLKAALTKNEALGGTVLSTKEVL
ncbi:MAG: imidazoleglycerol-phosphate dehydratase HisB [Clostridia bacterium]|nr:imidazoleglycerol-phosphate dehydratase HisB [Clostridia bacterium]MBQ3056042.1 imidazoleglycerol-phosphate dehydratase HisB [Clostridia bacterium]